jgi:two-component system, cell cycle sensor histidine kinase and response regulator CckA
MWLMQPPLYREVAMEFGPMVANDGSSVSAADRAVLVMDDEASIRKLVASMLECLGYRAVTCANGEEAISSYADARRSGLPYLAVIMDLVVAEGMGGREAALHILGMDPDAKLIVSSGFSADQVMDSPKRYGFLAALAKPYTIQDLASLLSEILGQDSTGGHGAVFRGVAGKL